MSVKLQTEHYLEFLRLKEGCTGSSESIVGNHMSRLNYEIGYLLLISKCMPNYTKTCPFLHAHYTEIKETYFEIYTKHVSCPLTFLF